MNESTHPAAPDARATPSASREARVQSICLLLLATLATGFALRWLSPVLIPFVLALFISLGLDLSIEWLVARTRAPRALALPVVLVLGLGALGGMGALIGASLGQLAESAPVYIEQLGQLMDRVANALPFTVEAQGGALDALRNIPVSTIGGLLTRTGNAVLNLLSQSLLVLIFVVFLMLGSGSVQHGGVWSEVRRRVESYLVTKIGVSVATGVLVGGALAALGVPLAMAFGVLAFLLNFIPTVGSLIATLLPLPVVIITPEVSPAAAIAAILLPAAIQTLMGNFVEPKLMGDSLDLHPIAILLSLILWGMLWGVVGMLLATPITAVLKMLLERFEGARPLAELLAGRSDALLQGGAT